ncbi:MAG: hypothetical protein WBQ17_12130 [Rhizomicrobium sp.]
MLLRAALISAIILTASAAQALPLDQFTLPSNDPAQQKKDSSDGLFNHSLPDRWDNSSSSRADGDSLGKMHFSVTSSQDVYPASRLGYGDATTPMSEFYGPTPPRTDDTDPLLTH